MGWLKKLGNNIASVGKAAVNVTTGMATVGLVKPFKNDPLASTAGDVAKVVSRAGVVVGAAVAAPILVGGAAAAGAATTAATSSSVAASTAAGAGSAMNLGSLSSFASPVISTASQAIAGKISAGNAPAEGSGTVQAGMLASPSSEKVLLYAALGIGAAALVAALARR